MSSRQPGADRKARAGMLSDRRREDASLGLLEEKERTAWCSLWGDADRMLAELAPHR